MAGTPSIKEVLDLTASVDRHRRDRILIDQITVIRGYAELVKFYPDCDKYRWRLHQAVSAFIRKTTDSNPGGVCLNFRVVHADSGR